MHDPQDKRGVPVSSGIPKIVIWLTAIGVLMIFAIGGWTILDSGYGHVWPSVNSERVKL
ncbi:MAG: hypothetical protein M3Z14_05265 [Candidatus Eremiobacteraeota bacterium]|nr:hypothetical protein [Candidatus Eremiobacteraeota bacterium]